MWKEAIIKCFIKVHNQQLQLKMNLRACYIIHTTKGLCRSTFMTQEYKWNLGTNRRSVSYLWEDDIQKIPKVSENQRDQKQVTRRRNTNNNTFQQHKGNGRNRTKPIPTMRRSQRLMVEETNVCHQVYGRIHRSIASRASNYSYRQLLQGRNKS